MPKRRYAMSRPASAGGAAAGRTQQWHARQPQSSQGRNSPFVKQGKMKTAKAAMEERRQGELAADRERYLGDAPADATLIHASLVAPANQTLPRALDGVAALDDIRTKYHVWITRSKPNVFDLYSHSIRGLQQALKAVSWALHHMRLATGDVKVRLLAQKPVRVAHDAMVQVKLNARPVVKSTTDLPIDIFSAAKYHFDQLHNDLIPSTDALRDLVHHLKMRVNFGLVEVRSRAKGLGNSMPYSDFAEMVAKYSNRGGAIFESQLSNLLNAGKVIQKLKDLNTGGYSLEEQPYDKRCTVALRIENKELVAHADMPTTGTTHLSAAKMAMPDAWPRLNWVTTAPDMKLDWNFQVDSQVSMPVPDKLARLMHSIVLIPQRGEASRASIICPPKLIAGHLFDKVDETMLKTSVLIPFRNTSFVVEVAVTQVWSGMKTLSKPDTWWSLEFYGQDWDKAVNRVRPGERRKNWGKGLEAIWPGSGAWEDRFMDFIQHILEIQSALSDVDLGPCGRNEGAQG